MGQKVHPIGIRLGISRDWESKWFVPPKEYSNALYADFTVRKYIRENFESVGAGISRVQIDRLARNARITIYAARPGVIIGRSGKEIEGLRDTLNKMLNVPVHVSIEEVRKPELDAQLVAESIAQQLKRRVMFRRAIKRAISSAMRSGALGVKVSVRGRLGGAEIAREEWSREGRVPLQVFRADISYAGAKALTTYGVIGIKVWIFKGEILGDKISEGN